MSGCMEERLWLEERVELEESSSYCGACGLTVFCPRVAVDETSSICSVPIRSTVLCTVVGTIKPAVVCTVIHSSTVVVGQSFILHPFLLMVLLGWHVGYPYPP